MSSRLVWLPLLVAVYLTLGVAAAATAGQADFEDVNVGDVFDRDPGTANPDEFVSGDVTFRLIAGSTNVNFARAEVLDDPFFTAGGTGNDLAIGNVEVEFDFGSPVEQLSIRAGYFGGDMWLRMNGNQFLPSLDLNDYPLDFNGITVDLVNFANVPGGITGFITLDGTLDSFSIFGQELVIDDVSFLAVPEPGVVSLWAAALGSLALGRLVGGRRRRAA